MTHHVTDGDKLTLRDLALNAYREAEQAREQARQEREEQARASRLTHLRRTAQYVLDFTSEHAAEVIPATGDGYHFTVDGLHFRVPDQESARYMEVYALKGGAHCPEWQGLNDLDDLGAILTSSDPEDPAEWVTLYNTDLDAGDSAAYRTMRRTDAHAFLNVPDHHRWTLRAAEG